jgi:hypothetical protein
MGDERGPEGPLFHGGAESVLFAGFEKARFHGFRQSVLVERASSAKGALGRT